MQSEQSAFKKSDEWLERRRHSIGGSDIAALMGRSPYKTPLKLWQEKTGRLKIEDLSHLPHIVRGHMSEEVARQRLERETLTAYRPKFWQHSTIPYFTASDDGYSVDHNHTIEIKAMGKDNHEQARLGKIPLHYQDQVQWGLMISGCVKCIFISYRVEDDDMVMIDVYPDLAHQEELVAAAKNFWLNHVLKDVAPAISEGDYAEIKDQALEELVTRYKELHAQSKTIDAQLEEVKARMRPFTATQRAISCLGVKLLRSEISGRIDYKKFLEANKVSTRDLEEFRSKPTEQFKVIIPVEVLTP